MYPSDTLADPTPTLPVLVGSVGITRQCTMCGEVYPPSVFFSPPVRPLSCARLRILPGPCVFSRAPDPRTEHFYAHFCLPHHDARDGHRPCPGDLRHDRDGLLRFRPSNVDLRVLRPDPPHTPSSLRRGPGALRKLPRVFWAHLRYPFRYAHARSITWTVARCMAAAFCVPRPMSLPSCVQHFVF